METVIAKVRVFASNMLSPPLKAAIEKIWVFVFFLIHVGGLLVFNKNLKVYIICNKEISK